MDYFYQNAVDKGFKRQDVDVLAKHHCWKMISTCEQSPVNTHQRLLCVTPCLRWNWKWPLGRDRSPVLINTERPQTWPSTSL